MAMGTKPMLSGVRRHIAKALDLNPATPEQMWASIAADHKSVGEMLRSVNYKPE